MTTPETSLWRSLSSRARQGCAGFLACAGLACTPSIEDYPRELEEARCYREHECHAFERVRDCIDTLVIDRDPEFDYLVRAAAAGSVEYNREAAAECLDAIRELGCNYDDAEPEVCDRVFVGKVGKNEPCLKTAECAGNAICGYPPSCTDQCCVGACRVFADPLAIGEPCSFSGTPCVPEAFCAQDPMTGMTTVCTALVKAGGDCSLGQRCDEDSECDGNECRKVKEAAVGESCDGPNVRCVEPARCNYDDGEARCKIEPTLGAPCDPDRDSCRRVDTYCDRPSGLCTLLPGPGQSCNDASCLPYASCESVEGMFGESGQNLQSCVRLPTEGEACEEYSTCLGQLQCIDGTCKFPELDTAPVCKVP